MKIIPLSPTMLSVYSQQLSEALPGALNTTQCVPGEVSDIKDAISRGQLLMWIARDEEGITGAIQLRLAQTDDAINRAEINALVVHQRCRRRGIGRHLLETLESAARAHKRGLICLGAKAGSGAELFYRAQGYRCLGELPDYTFSQHNGFSSSMIYYKRLFAAVSL
ncbi:GNAT family N-acetyltransferase [Mangrovibacter plantisponsor]|uniref:Acetyltransferase (GNAT) family protein n=1 Tax=Mangrovibacter plantisponsor TaxID=451513 RepID=A0A317PH94_9ENTR|nr:GNAT family N-acetyltransferase [Mangrovibacter plantisponsor]PWV99552.1 acetyltransferase (GNAT) family protein [Mangrovibacter plantisponsor]